VAPFPGRWTYVGQQARQCLILAAPPFLLLLVQQTLFALFPDLQRHPVLMPLSSGALLAVLFAGWPWLLRMLLNLQPLPEGPLRQRLEQTARRLSFRCRDILVWDTHDTLATALLVGPLPTLRYVVLTDRLLQHMEPEEVEAVFGHEVGHVKHRHMTLYLVFLLASLLALSALWDWLLEWLPKGTGSAVLAWLPWPDFWRGNPELLLAGPMLLTLLVYLFVVFGLLSRRCERQADLYACRAVAAPPFIAALEKVARLNGLSRDRPGWLASWRHGTIAQRVECLRRLQADPGLEAGYQRHIGLVKWGVLAGLGGLLLVLGPDRLLDLLRQL
jgi:Zn-dependent protease with chaperone function